MSEDRFESVYARHAGRLYAFLVYRTGEPALAEDLLADVFERALRGWRRFDPRRGTEEAWLFAIALNRMRDHQRRAATERAALERLTAASPRAAAEGPEARTEHGALAEALTVLEDVEREAIALRYGADLTMEQIGRVTGVPVTTVDGRVRRGLRALRAELEGHER